MKSWYRPSWRCKDKLLARRDSDVGMTIRERQDKSASDEGCEELWYVFYRLLLR